MSAGSGSEDEAGIAALAELVAARPAEAMSDLSVPVSALVSQRSRPAGAGDEETDAGLPLRPRVLLVEDNPVNRLLVGVLLDRLDLEHIAVGCGEEAILRIAREPFDAVLLDVAMDGMAGIDTARAIHALIGTAAPPIVALGSATLDDDVLELAGFSAVAKAPLDTTRLARALIIALESALAAQSTNP